MPASPRRPAADAIAVGVAVDAQHLGACRRSASAWPPSPRVASTTRRAPAAAASTGREQDGNVDWDAGRRSCRALAVENDNTPSAGTGWHVQQRERG